MISGVSLSLLQEICHSSHCSSSMTLTFSSQVLTCASNVLNSYVNCLFIPCPILKTFKILADPEDNGFTQIPNFQRLEAIHVQNRWSRVQTLSLGKSSVCQDPQNLCFPALIMAVSCWPIKDSSVSPETTETLQTSHSLIHWLYFLILSLGNKQELLATFYLLIFLSRTLQLLWVPRPYTMSCSCTRNQILFTLMIIS